MTTPMSVHRMTQLMSGLVLAWFCTAIQAATLNVTSTADSGPGTLRDALASAANGPLS